MMTMMMTMMAVVGGGSGDEDEDEDEDDEIIDPSVDVDVGKYTVQEDDPMAGLDASLIIEGVAVARNGHEMKVITMWFSLCSQHIKTQTRRS